MAFKRSGNWHLHINPRLNRWQHNNRWRSWTSAGCPVAQTHEDQDIVDLVGAYLAVSPSDRPSLLEVQAELLDELHRRSDSPAGQVSILLHIVESQSAAAEWQHLEGCIEGLERTIKEHYPRDALPTDWFATGERQVTMLPAIYLVTTEGCELVDTRGF